MNDYSSKKYLKMKRLISLFLHSLFSIIYILALLVLCISSWIEENLSISWVQLLGAITDDTTGANIESILRTSSAKKQIIIFVIGSTIIISVLIIECVIKRRKKKNVVLRLYRVIWLIIISFVSCDFLILSVMKLRVWEDKRLIEQTTSLFEDYYIPTKYSMVSAQEETNNLIYIYMESMESTLTCVDEGGEVEGDSIIPNLSALAKDNISFSSGSKVGGLYSTNRTNYTKGGLVATTAGIPAHKDFIEVTKAGADVGKNVVTLGDILSEHGYTNEFLCGSDGDFAKRKSYFTKHGNYKFFDYYTAIDEGYIDSNYKVWWGYEDKILYEIAKDEITDLANSREKFNFTMLTVDTHYPSGYVCDLCGNTYDEQYFNVYECADKQIKNFIDWCEQQDWFEHTTIIITGDHPTMCADIFQNVSATNRKVYNCIINSVKEAPENEKQRSATTMDMFPTTLSALGFDVKGDKLGLGTDLFSDTPTLCETMTYDVLNDNLIMKSTFYSEYYE